MLEGVVLGNRYQLIEKIGGGGMAVVYKAKCNVLNRYVAVKVLRNDYVNEPEIVERFKAEAQAAARLSHPNIVSVYDVGEHGSYMYFVMECIQGVTLKSIIQKEGALHYEDVIHFGIQIAGALAHAHESGIVHRDIKPHNIMVTNDGVAKVTDFGIARATNTASTLTNLGNAIGSVHYFSPEQATSGVVDAKSDIYSLGITLFEMATGKLPFNGESPVSIALKHLNDPASPAKVVNNDVPTGLNDIIMKCIRKEPMNRYQNCDELIRDLYAVLKNPNAPLSEVPVKETTKVASKLSKTYEASDSADDDLYNAVMRDKQQKKENRQNKKEEKSSDKTKAVLIIVGVLIAFIAVGVWLWSAVTGKDNSVADSFVLENYVGRNCEEVQSELSEKYSWLTKDRFKIEYEENKSAEDGTIVEQKTNPGARIVQGGMDNIIFVVSSGMPKAHIPSFVGREYDTYVEELRELGFVVSDTPTKKFDDTVEKGKIIATIPESSPDTEYEHGTTVEIIVSKGPKVVKFDMPSLVGKTYKDAKKIIEENKLVLGSVLPSNNANDSLIVESHTPAEGEEVKEGDTISLVLKTTSSVNFTVTSSHFDAATNSQNISLSSVLASDGVDYSVHSFKTTVSYVTNESSASVVLKQKKITYDELPLACTGINIPINDGYARVTVSVVYNGDVYTYKEVIYGD